MQPPNPSIDRALLSDVSTNNLPPLLAEWSWLIPKQDTPLLLSVFGDWVLGAPDGSLWCLSLLEGDYSRIAANAGEYNTLNKSAEWLDQTFLASWQEIAHRHGINPTPEQCIGWKLHPLLGGKFEVTNLQLFDMLVYQSLMGQLHRQLRQRPGPSKANKKPWYKLW